MAKQVGGSPRRLSRSNVSAGSHLFDSRAAGGFPVQPYLSISSRDRPNLFGLPRARWISNGIAMLELSRLAGNDKAPMALIA